MGMDDDAREEYHIIVGAARRADSTLRKEKIRQQRIRLARKSGPI